MSHSRTYPSLALTVLIGCAATQDLMAQATTDSSAMKDSAATEAPALETAKQKVKADPTRITAEEIAAARVATGYEAVDRLRHVWFKDRLSGQAVTVYSDDNQSLGGAESLRKVPAADIKELRYLDGREATLRWPEAKGGAIIVVQDR